MFFILGQVKAIFTKTWVAIDNCTWGASGGAVCPKWGSNPNQPQGETSMNQSHTANAGKSKRICVCVCVF